MSVPETQVLRALADAPMRKEPFAHLLIDGIFPPEYYREVLQAAASARFERATYPGTGVNFDARSWQDHGLVATGVAPESLLGQLFGFLSSERFARALLYRFAAPGSRGPGASAIPPEKFRFFQDADDFAAVQDLQLDQPGYEIAPHPDHASKIVTYLFYLPADDSLREYGTLLFRPKTGVQPRHPRPGLLPRVLNRLAGPYGLMQRSDWYDWDDFEIAGMAPALPNTLLVFAPNETTFHGVRFDPPEELAGPGRPVIRGFIRSGRGKRNYLADYPGGLRPIAMQAARLADRLATRRRPTRAS
ncbi:MAG: hypothetical protein LJE84_10990 [Gammaproteobacteria bacterium]|nr:hypothetical protein [Gammaproteobacteria bacterium]